MTTNRAINATFRTLLLVALSACSPPSVTESADSVFVNGKVLTVDADFSVAEAVAVKGNTILAVGTTESVEALIDATTRVVDLNGRTLIPGLIDNHNHLVFNAPTWPNGVRLGNARTRAEALDLIAAKAEALGPGDGPEHLVFALGGWHPVQFTDVQREFTRAELDAIAPDNPVYTQVSWFSAVLNSKAMALGGISEDIAEPPASTGGKIWRDDDGKLTGKFTGPIYLKWQLRPLFPAVTGPSVVAGLKAEIADYLQLGVTTSMTFNGPEFPEEVLPYIQTHLADSGELDMRIYYPPHFDKNVSAWTPEEVPTVVAGLASLTPHSGTEMYQMSHFGEHVYLPVSDSFRRMGRGYPDDEMQHFRTIVTAAAEHGWQVAEHVSQDIVANQMLEIFEEVNDTYPITALRWRLEHAQGLTQATIERAKRLGVGIGVHSAIAMSSPDVRAGNGAYAEIAAVQDAPPLRWYQDSGIAFGLGSDAQVVAHDSPFFTLYWAVTGKDTSGQQLLKYGTLTREEALIAHTRSNAYLMHKESLLGSIEIGKLADLVVIDRDYMTIPADEIRDLKSVFTMVDGRVVYDAL